MAHFAGYYSRSGEPAEITEAGFLGRIPFQSPKQQCHSTEWLTWYTHGMTNADQIMHVTKLGMGHFHGWTMYPTLVVCSRGKIVSLPLMYARVI